MNFFQLGFLLSAITLVYCQLNDDLNDDKIANRTPIYIIANMANTISEAETFLSDGANGLQIDVQFSSSGIPKTTQHGLPCSCSRNCMKSENFKDYLSFLRRTTTPGAKDYNQRLSLIFINLKIDALTRGVLYSAGEKFADDIINYLYARGKEPSSRAWVVLGLPDLRSFAFVRGFRNAFESANMKLHLERFGYSVQKFSRSDKLKAALLGAGISNRIWVGTGSSNCKRVGTPQRVIRLAAEREIIRKLGVSFVDKVYTWTVDLPNNMRETLRLGIDAVITNKPNQLKIVLKEAEFEPFLRLADASDVPWQWNTRSINTKLHSNDKALMLKEIDKELDDLNLSAEADSKTDDSKNDKKFLEKLLSDRLDKHFKTTDKKGGSLFDILVSKFKNLFS